MQQAGSYLRHRTGWRRILGRTPQIQMYAACFISNIQFVCSITAEADVANPSNKTHASGLCLL